ncbi:hypothetical protein [Acidiluteibacter ferrifornacis]|uniref:DUF2029 domain-containing protein n=1 Tax=Acidiluteibacter ferrifornacis TaxID=2692424 RepID=A0A6N9NDW5_9FLAO|nr:hypothetical protein [Acidiluteibacter ferrifornacis]NBG64806.1 hypothetical protein [Acidiluteibacter ferrifornacis]
MKLTWQKALVVFGSGLIYLFIAYYLNREEWYYLFPSIAALFGGYLYLAYSRQDSLFQPNHKLFNDYPILWMAIAFRFIFIFSLPELSDDFYRFIWDGLLSVNEINPFLQKPTEVLQMTFAMERGFTSDFLNRLNSPEYYTVYPAFSQYLFMISAYIGDGNILGSVVILRIIIFAAEVGTIVLLSKLLYLINISRKAVLIYALNPLIIIELVGNVHVEAIMIFFLVAAFYQLQKGNWIYSAILMSLAICTKLIPLMLLPLLLPTIGLKKSVKYYSVVLGGCLVLFYPFLSEATVLHIGNSVGLYFQNFEFNASLYFILREVGFWITSYNQIGIIGPILSIISLGLILWISFKKLGGSFKIIFVKAILVLSIYFAFATVVHPWYLSTLIVFAVFLKGNRFALIWSALVYLSYFTYRDSNYHELVGLTLLSYLPVYYFFYRDVILDKKLKARSNKQALKMKQKQQLVDFG